MREHLTLRRAVRFFSFLVCVGVLSPAVCAGEEQSGKTCGCPVTPEEKILIPCKSTVDPQSCGACSVMSTDGKRIGRPCLAVPSSSHSAHPASK